MKSFLTEGIAWLGTACILLAYIFLSFNILQSQSFLFQFLNFFGAGTLIVHSLRKKDYQPVALNIVWGLVALIALLGMLL